VESHAQYLILTMFLVMLLSVGVAVQALGGLTIGCHVLQEERVLRNNKNYETLDTNKNGVRFRSAALTDLNSEYMQAHDSYTEKQKAIVNEIINIAGQCHLMVWNPISQCLLSSH
jgi:DNA mismatch repair ATPase MutS